MVPRNLQESFCKTGNFPAIISLNRSSTTVPSPAPQQKRRGLIALPSYARDR